MGQNSKTLSIFAMLFTIGHRHRGELKSFDPSVNLENFCIRGKGLKAVPPVVYILHAFHLWKQLTYTYRCELISFLLIRVFQNLLTENVKEAHTLCICCIL